MSRRNPPTLVNPDDVVSAATDQQLGITSRQSLEERLSAVERLLVRQDGVLARLLRGLVPVMPTVQAGPSGPPTIAAQAAAGSTATATITGNDEEGIIVLTPGGAGITTGTQAIITFKLPRASANYTVHLQPFSAAARTAGATVGPASRSASSWQITTGTALSSGSVYQYLYRVGKVYT
jgi:hypothetical protein